MKQRIIILPFVLYAVIACSVDEQDTDEFFPHANQIDTIRHDGELRTYKLYIPESYTETTATALLIALHGYGNTATEMEEASLLNEKADTEGFIVVYPDGKNYPVGDNNTQIWNAGNYSSEITGGTDDVGFISKTIDLIQKYYNINPNQVYVTGFSNGASMSYKLGIELSCKIAAIAPHSGFLTYMPSTLPGCKIPVLHVHGQEDGIVPYNSLVVEEVLCYWNNWEECNQQCETTFENDAYLVKEWLNSDSFLYLSKTGRHDWFTSENSGIEINNIMWDFFEDHPKNQD
jgi:polyhydroxybutyrate depolymerase